MKFKTIIKTAAALAVLTVMAVGVGCGAENSESTEASLKHLRKKLSGNILMVDNEDMLGMESNMHYSYSDASVLGCSTDRIVRGEIDKVEFLDVLDDMPEDAWDVSENGDGSVMAWLTFDDEEICLFIAGEGGVDANPDSSFLFCGYSNVTSINFNNCFNTTNVEDMYRLFWGCALLENLDLTCFDTSDVVNMNHMFTCCSSLEELDLSNFDTSNVTDMNCMFGGCESLKKLIITDFDTSSVTDMSGMFMCSSLKELDLSGFDTSNVIDMSAMFDECGSLEELDLSSFDTSNVTDMMYMFNGCNALEKLDVTSFDTSNVTDMSYMFYNCSSLEELDISNFDMSNADTTGMFEETVFE